MTGLGSYSPLGLIKGEPVKTRCKGSLESFCWIGVVWGPVKVNLSYREWCVNAFGKRKMENQNELAFSYSEALFIPLVCDTY